jgi:hypothetical protein
VLRSGAGISPVNSDAGNSISGGSIVRKAISACKTLQLASGNWLLRRRFEPQLEQPGKNFERQVASASALAVSR